jgi:hypothetical protein
MVSETQEERTFCPLFNFIIYNRNYNPAKTFVVHNSEQEFNNFKHLEFLGNSVLTTVSKKELSYDSTKNISGSYLKHIPASFFSWHTRIAVIEIFEKKGKIVSFIENVETALRLFKEGDVFCKFLFSEKSSEKHFSLLDQTYELPNTLHSKTYELKREEIKQINVIFVKLQNVDIIKEKTLKVAIERFNRSYGKSMPDEKIVDFFIGFEALLVKEDTVNQKPIIATGASMLLGKNQTERQTIYDFFIYAYKIRNKIVHGETGLYTGSVLGETAEKLKQYLREAIIRLL